jgi:hypothetical protein
MKYDYMTIYARGVVMCVFDCDSFEEMNHTFRFKDTHIPKEAVHKITVSRRPGVDEVLFERPLE